MCVAGLCCFSALEVTVKKKIKGKKKIPFPLFFKRALAAPGLPLSFYARRLLLFCSLILTATADCGAFLCRTSSQMAQNITLELRRGAINQPI